jgi:hypothetical protein
VDVFVNPNIQTDYNNRVYVINQIDQSTGEFDEHKVMLGYTNQLAAIKAYKRNYEKGWKVGPLTEMIMPEFKVWLQNTAATKQKATPKYSAGVVEGAKDLVNAPNAKWVKAVLGTDKLTPPSDIFAFDHSKKGERLRLTKKGVAAVKRIVPGANFKIVRNWTQVPPVLAKQMEKAGQQGARGVHYDGISYVFSDFVNSEADAVKIALHELTHGGLIKTFGNKLDPLLDDLYANIPKKHQNKFDQIVKLYKFDLNEQEHQRAAAEELIAHIAQEDPKATIVQRFVAAIRKILRKAGLKGWTESDILALIAEAQGSYGRRGNLDQIVFSEDVMIEETGEVFTVEETAAELLNQQDKRIGVVEKLKQCL